MNHTEQEALEEPKEVNGFFCIFSPFWRFHFYLEENEIFHGKFVMVKTHLRCKYTYIKFDTKIPNHSLPLTVSRSPSLHLLRDV